MSGRTAGWTAWGSWALTVLTMALTLLLVSLNEPSTAWSRVLTSLLILAFSTVGALVASRRPENAIGWLFLSGAFVWSLGELALEYGVYALITAPGALPAGEWAAWFGAWARGVGWFLIVVFLLLLFPTGRLPSQRWRPVLWASAGYIAFFTIAIWLSPQSFDLRLVAVARNPLGVDLERMNAFLDAVTLSFPGLILASGTAVIVRFRRSVGDERQQLKWFAYAVAVMVVVFTAWLSLDLARSVAPETLAFTIPLIGLPIAVGVAILRYRLYDIDILINRTLVYGSLTVALALVYLGSVVLIQGAFRTFTGQGSTLAVVASTLAIAGLFNPLRRRIQNLIDRRFYRRKYDARRTLEAFSARLRGISDLEGLNGELLAVVHETVQPEHASLWLRSLEGRR